MTLLFWGATTQEPYAILRQAVGVKASYACVVRTLELDTSSGVALGRGVASSRRRRRRQ